MGAGRPGPLRTSYHGVQGTLITNGPNGTELYSTTAPARAPRTGPRWRCPREGRAPPEATCGPGTGGAGGEAGGGAVGGREQRFRGLPPRRAPDEGAASPRMARDVQEVIEAVYRSAGERAGPPLPLD